MENPLDEYFSYDPRKDLEQFSKVPTETWIKIGEQKALENFQIVSKAVPAYRDFLKKNKVNPDSIKTIEDFKKIPLTTKENYFKNYPLNELVLGGEVTKSTTFHFSSGSTGKAFYWPKSITSDINISKGIELFYIYYFNLDKLETLFINCFGMGPWAAGEINHTSVKMMAQKGLKVSVVSPGTNVDLFFTIFQDLAKNFNQVIIAGYSSFLKNIVDEGIRRKINFKEHNIKVLTGGEKFSENWRRYLSEHLGFKNRFTSVASVLGTSETGVTSISTPFTDFLRDFATDNFELTKNFFARRDLPSITQVITPSRYVEIVQDNITVTCLGFTPLIRYDTRDKGQILSPQDIITNLPKSFLEQYRNSLDDVEIPNLPILTIDGRSDGTIIFYGANIYYEQISYILDSPEVEKYLTGRFEVKKFEDSNSNPNLTISLELKKEIPISEELNKSLQKLITDRLLKLNSEYNYINNAYGEKTKPIIILKENGSNEVVPINGKAFKIKT